MKCPSFVSWNPISFWQRNKEEHRSFPSLLPRQRQFGSLPELLKLPTRYSSHYQSSCSSWCCTWTYPWPTEQGGDTTPYSRQALLASPTALPWAAGKGSRILSLFGRGRKMSRETAAPTNSPPQASSLFHSHSLLCHICILFSPFSWLSCPPQEGFAVSQLHSLREGTKGKWSSVQPHAHCTLWKMTKISRLLPNLLCRNSS